MNSEKVFYNIKTFQNQTSFFVKVQLVSGRDMIILNCTLKLFLDFLRLHHQMFMVLSNLMQICVSERQIMNLRNISREDIPALTEICRLGMEYDAWFRELVAEKTVDAKDFDPELGIVAEEDGDPAGFIQGVFGDLHGTPRGWVRLLVVHPRHRCKGIGGALLKELENRLIDKGAEEISIMDVPGNYHMPGVDHRYKEAFCFLPKMGYKRGIPNINLICEIFPGIITDKHEELLEKRREEGFDCRLATKSDWEGIKKFLKANWECWINEAASCLDTDPSTLYICVHGDEVVGFSGYEGNNRGTGWFGPMGVDPVTRGKSIGALLLLLCLRDMALIGHRKAIIPWVGPVRFYDKICNADMDRIFWTYLKKLK